MAFTSHDCTIMGTEWYLKNLSIVFLGSANFTSICWAFTISTENENGTCLSVQRWSQKFEKKLGLSFPIHV